jgi:hypothetical protein
LVCCTKKNLATLSWTRPKVFFFIHETSANFNSSVS